LREFVVGLVSLGLCGFPVLLMHLHVEYAETRGMLHDKRWKWAVLLFFYAAAFHMATQQFPRIGAPGFDFVLPGDTLPNGWTVKSGRVRVTGGVLRANQKPGERLCLFNCVQPMQDAAIQIDFKFDGGRGINVSCNPSSGETKKQ